jgi:hypothetical protein
VAREELERIARETGVLVLTGMVVEHREAIRIGRRQSVPQVAFSDYMGLMEQASRELGLER